MIKGFALIAKRADLDTAAFRRHWCEVHGPIALSIKTLKRYSQSHRSALPVPGFDHVPYDGAAEIWFDSLKDLQDMPNNPDYINGAQADEPNFIDTAKLKFVATQEKVVIDSAPITRETRWAKAIFLLKRRPDLSVEQFQDYWLNGHGPQIPRDAEVVRYVQCHTLAQTYGGAEQPAYDGVAELWFATEASFLAYWNNPKIQQIFADDAPRFLGDGCTAFMAQEHRVRWP